MTSLRPWKVFLKFYFRSFEKLIFSLFSLFSYFSRTFLAPNWGFLFKLFSSREISLWDFFHLFFDDFAPIFFTQHTIFVFFLWFVIHSDKLHIISTIIIMKIVPFHTFILQQSTKMILVLGKSSRFCSSSNFFFTSKFPAILEGLWKYTEHYPNWRIPASDKQLIHAMERRRRRNVHWRMLGGVFWKFPMI